METVSEEFKKKHAKAERSGHPSDSTFQIVNYLTLMGDRLPKGTSLSGEVVRGLIEIAEKRGCSIPGSKWADIPGPERRSLQAAFNKISADLPVPTPYKNRTKADDYDDAELRRREARQRAEFERLCNEADPLLKIANKMAVHKVMPGTLSEEDQALLDASRRLSKGL